MNLSPIAFAIVAFGVALSPMVVGAVTRNTTPTGKSDRMQVAQLERDKPANKKPATTPSASSPAKDAGGRDPADFPRPAGLVRTSSSQSTRAIRSEEIATYHAETGFDETVKLYLDAMQAAGWKKQSDSVSGSGLNRLQMIEWQTPAKEAEIRFYAAKKGSDLRVRVFTYKTSQATTPEKSDTTLKTAPAAKVDPAKMADQTEKFGGAPVGPPPTGFNVQSYNPYSHQLSWSATSWTGFDLYRVDADGRTQVANKIKATGMIDHAFLAPNTVYRLVVNHADGSEGSLEYTYANPPQPAVVTGLKAEQTGPGKIKLTWNRAQPAVGNTVVAETYQVTSPTFPAADQRVGVNSLEITGMSVGNHWARVAMVYGDSSKMAPAPKDTAVNFDVLTDRGRYRIVFLGLRCEQETKDDPLQLDGKRDEVYTGAYVARVTRGTDNTPPAPGNFVRTKVMGDANGFADRLQAGTASAAGGIQSGDFVPSSAAVAPQPGVATTNDRFPLLVWEGELRDSSDLLVIAPVLFSWNKADEGPWNSWSGWWSTPNGSKQLRIAARAAVRPDNLWAWLSGEWQHDVNANTIHDDFPDPITRLVKPLDPNRKRRYGPEFTMSADRPIGLEDQNASGNALAVPSLFWVPFGLVLTRTNIEAKLGGNPAVLYQRAFTDDKLSNASLGGNYSLYIQIERLAPPPGN